MRHHRQNGQARSRTKGYRRTHDEGRSCRAPLESAARNHDAGRAARVAIAAALLFYENAIISPKDLSRVNAAFFNVNVNHSLSEPECSQFGVLDSRNPDGEALNPEQVEVGSAQFSKTTDFTGDGMQQTEAQYFHRYENGSCYEFVLGLDTAGFGTDSKIEAVNRDEVFAKLEKILASVKIQPAEVEKEQQVASQTTTPADESAK